jgi:hypothetical protein
MLKSKVIVAALTVAGGLCAAPPVVAPKPAPAPVQTPAAPAPQALAPGVNSITEVMVKAGVLSSISRINQVMTYLTANAQSGAFLFLPKTMPDQSLVSVSVEVQSPNAAPIYASASFAPLTSGQAGAVYDAVQYLPQSCDYVEKVLFKGLKRAGILRKDVIALDGGTVKIFLMPAGTGCIVIKKEVVQ